MAGIGQSEDKLPHRSINDTNRIQSFTQGNLKLSILNIEFGPPRPHTAPSISESKEKFKDCNSHDGHTLSVFSFIPGADEASSLDST